MDMTDVPDFKLAKVGRDKRRRGGGLPFYWGGGAGGGWTGALGGAGLPGAGMTLGKTLILLAVMGGLGASAWQLGRVLTPNYGAAKHAASRVFDSKAPAKYAGDLSKLPTESRSIPNSIGYVNESFDGLTPAQRARKRAQEEAARQAAQAAQANAQRDAAASAQKKAASGSTAVADAAGRDKAADSFKKNDKFGRLSSAFGSGLAGLSGGSGLSGGIGRGFANAANGFHPESGRPGELTAFNNPARASYGKGVSASARGVSGHNRSLGQLKNTAGLSGQGAKAGEAQNSASLAGAPFDSNAGQGNIITGPGVQPGAPGGPTSGSSANPATGSGGGPVDNGGAAANCSSGQTVAADGSCQNVATPSSSNATPWQSLITIAEALMGLVSALAIFALMTKPTPWLEKAIQTIIAIAGGLVTALGAMILAMSHDPTAGGIVTAVGVFTVASAYIATNKLIAKGGGVTAQGVANLACRALIVNALGLLAANAESGSMQ